jgi:hypothetical protein
VGVRLRRPQPQPGVVYPPGWTDEKVTVPVLETHGLALTDAEDRSGASLYVGPDGSPTPAMFGRDGRVGGRSSGHRHGVGHPAPQVNDYLTLI